MAVDMEVQQGLDGLMLPWRSVTSRSMFGGVCYMVDGKMFAALMEGMGGHEAAGRAKGQGAHDGRGVAVPGPLGRPFGRWIQFVILMEEDVSSVAPWLEAGAQPRGVAAGAEAAKVKGPMTPMTRMQ